MWEEFEVALVVKKYLSVFSQLLKVEVALSEVGVARPEGPGSVGGSGGMLPQEILKF